jgi:hypothetical protein
VTSHPQTQNLNLQVQVSIIANGFLFEYISKVNTCSSKEVSQQGSVAPVRICIHLYLSKLVTADPARSTRARAIAVPNPIFFSFLLSPTSILRKK